MSNTGNTFYLSMNLKHKLLLAFFLIVVVLSFSSCKNNRKQEEITKVVNEWTGKEIRFPENVPCYVLGKDTLPVLCDEHFRKAYKILMYIDSAGCSDCRLKLFDWKQLMAEADSLFQGQVGFLLYFQPKNVRDMQFLFLRDRFDYPVFMDLNGELNRLNRFPQEMQFQCFLLDENNRVLMIGNPVSNMRIWELYKEQIAGGKKSKPEILTTVEVDKTVHDYGTIRKGGAYPAKFTITNTGNHPLIIYRVSTSCGCTGVEWDRQPVEAGQTATVRVEMTPDETGRFSKTIDVYCNANNSPVRLSVTGTTIE
jgi:hypothetical protein